MRSGRAKPMLIHHQTNALDAVFLSFVLELFDTTEIPKMLAECLRVLRLGGQIVVVSLSQEGKSGIALRLFEWMHQLFPYFMNCRPLFVRRALTAAGFNIKSAQKGKMWGTVELRL